VYKKSHSALPLKIVVCYLNFVTYKNVKEFYEYENLIYLYYLREKVVGLMRVCLLGRKPAVGELAPWG